MFDCIIEDSQRQCLFYVAHMSYVFFNFFLNSMLVLESSQHAHAHLFYHFMSDDDTFHGDTFTILSIMRKFNLSILLLQLSFQLHTFWISLPPIFLLLLQQDGHPSYLHPLIFFILIIEILFFSVFSMFLPKIGRFMKLWYCVMPVWMNASFARKSTSLFAFLYTCVTLSSSCYMIICIFSTIWTISHGILHPWSNIFLTASESVCKIIFHNPLTLQ